MNCFCVGFSTKSKGASAVIILNYFYQILSCSWNVKTCESYFEKTKVEPVRRTLQFINGNIPVGFYSLYNLAN